MTIIGLDDTDSRDFGMCTTYVASELADTVKSAGGHVERILLVRLNPAVEHKTRGNAALAIHCEIDSDRALELGERALDLAATEDANTNPGLVVTDCMPASNRDSNRDSDSQSVPRSVSTSVPKSVARFARTAVKDYCKPDEAATLASDAGFETATRGNGRGLIGALAAVGAWRAFSDWTYECISYREDSNWGTPRQIDEQSVFEAADAGYPTVWDTVDKKENVAVCVPRTPCPILHAIRGDDAEAVCSVADAIEGEPVAKRQLFVTNQGTDAHLQEGTLETAQAGRSYRIDARVVEPPETREGGHVFFTIAGDEEAVNVVDNATGSVDVSDRPNRETLQVAAFEPTKRFRDVVRKLRVGDRLTVCGEISDGTLKLEKFAIRELVDTERVTPDCTGCGRSMKSAGKMAGYRCRNCNTSAPGKVTAKVDRELQEGWYEVPPCARRHIAKPLVRGGFDAPTFPAR